MKNLKTILISSITLATMISPIITTTQVNAEVIENSSSGIQLVNKRESNLINNGDFKNGLDQWENYGFNGATISVKTEGEENYVELTNPNEDSGSIIAQTIPSSQLKEYSISFEYKGSNNGRFLVQASAGEIYDDFPIVNLSDSQETWKKYRGTIVMPEDEWMHWTALTLAFNNGEKGEQGSANPLHIKNVQLSEINN